MIDMKQAVQIARTQGRELLSVQHVDVEEIERDQYEGRKVWAITVSQQYHEAPPAGLAALRPPARRYNKLYIDIDSGEILGMKIREVSAA